MSGDPWNEKLYGYACPGRYGLGHSLLAWARCFLWCKDNEVAMLAPRWLYFRLGPYLRNEPDKRSYHKVFRKGTYIHGVRRAWLLAAPLGVRRFAEEHEPQAKLGRGTRIVVFKNDDRNNTRFFKVLFGRHEEVRSELLRIARPEHIPAANIDGPFIGIHVRMGDFSRISDPSALRTTSNVQLPVEWYRDILLSIRRQTGLNLRAHVFSDGDLESLRPLLALPNVSLAKPHSALHDILSLSQAAALISSGSGFSMWAAYLGQVPRICFPNQRRDYVVAALEMIDLEPECETSDDVAPAFVRHVARAFPRVGEMAQLS
jgi:Glycosyl transferase family 11